MNRKTLFNFLILVTLTLIVLPTSALCELKSLDDSGLSEVYAEGFAEFTITDVALRVPRQNLVSNRCGV